MGGRRWERLVAASLAVALRLGGGKVTRILSSLEALSAEGRALLEREGGFLWAPFNPESWFLKSLDLRPRRLAVKGSSPPNGKTGICIP